MRTLILLLGLAGATALTSGCSSIHSSGDSLPTAGEWADSRYYNSWPENGYTDPLPADRRPR